MAGDMKRRIEAERKRALAQKRELNFEAERRNTLGRQRELMKNPAGLLIREAFEIDEEGRYALAGLVTSYVAIGKPTERLPISLRQRFGGFGKTVPDRTVAGWELNVWREDSCPYDGCGRCTGVGTSTHIDLKNSLIVRPNYTINSLANFSNTEYNMFTVAADDVVKALAFPPVEWVEPEPETYR